MRPARLLILFFSLLAALSACASGDAGPRRAAEAYQKYQKCGMKAALNTFATGW